MQYLIHILILICIYMILALSLNLLVGYAGLLSLCHAAFYGVGAYTTALLTVKMGISFWWTLPIGMGLSMIISLLIAFPALRLKGDYFILATLAFQVIVYNLMYNWEWLTEGPYGIPGIPSPHLFGWELSEPYHMLILSGVMLSGVFYLFAVLYESPFGRTLKAIRDDEIAAESLGKRVPYFKIWAFVIAAGVAAISGSLYAAYISYIDPTSFTLDEAIFILALILVGGTGNLDGPFVGTIFLVILPELLRFLGMPDSVAANMRQIIYGLILVVLMYYRPQGIAGEYEFE